MLKTKNTTNILCATILILVGMGLITGGKVFQRPMTEGVKLLNIVQDTCLMKELTIA